MEPIDMVLHCPKCGLQHIDQVEERDALKAFKSDPEPWLNPPHRSHFCQGCGTIWRPADVPTNGVLAVQTRGKADTWPGARGHAAASRGMPARRDAAENQTRALTAERDALRAETERLVERLRVMTGAAEQLGRHYKEITAERDAAKAKVTALQGLCHRAVSEAKQLSNYAEDLPLALMGVDRRLQAIEAEALAPMPRGDAL